MGDVSFGGVRVTPAEDIEEGGTWNSKGTTTDTTEVDYFYQGIACISCQVKTGEVGMYYTDVGTIDYTTTPGKTWLAKFIQTNKDKIDGTGLQLAIGSGTGDYANYYIYTALTYPPLGGFQIVPIDPHVQGYVDAIVGTPVTASVNYYAIRSDASLQAKAPNLGIDAIDYISVGEGLTISGTSCVFQDFVDFDEGTQINKYGVVSTRDGIIYAYGTLNIGTNAVAAEFNDTNKVVVFPDGRVNTGFSGIYIDNSNAGTYVSMSACTFNGRGSNKGLLFQSADTRPNFTVSGTTGLGAYMDACSFTSFNQFNLTSSVNIQSCVLTNPNQATQSGATINGCTLEGPTVAASGSFLNANDLNTITNCVFAGTSSWGSAIELSGSTTQATYSFNGNLFSGYNVDSVGTNLTPSSGHQNSAIYNNSGGYVFINISDGDTPAVRNGVGATTEVSNPVTLTLTGIATGSDVTIISVPAGTLIFENDDVTGAGATGDVAFPYVYSAGTFVDILVFHTLYDPNLSNILNYELKSTNTSIPIKQILDNVYRNP